MLAKLPHSAICPSQLSNWATRAAPGMPSADGVTWTSARTLMSISVIRSPPRRGSSRPTTGVAEPEFRQRSREKLSNFGFSDPGSGGDGADELPRQRGAEVRLAPFAIAGGAVLLSAAVTVGSLAGYPGGSTSASADAAVPDDLLPVY